MFVLFECVYAIVVGLVAVSMFFCFFFSGTVDVFSVDETSGVWNLSHTLQFTKRQFPGTCMLGLVYV